MPHGTSRLRRVVNVVSSRLRGRCAKAFVACRVSFSKMVRPFLKWHVCSPSGNVQDMDRHGDEHKEPCTRYCLCVTTRGKALVQLQGRCCSSTVAAKDLLSLFCAVRPLRVRCNSSVTGLSATCGIAAYPDRVSKLRIEIDCFWEGAEGTGSAKRSAQWCAEHGSGPRDRQGGVAANCLCQ